MASSDVDLKHLGRVAMAIEPKNPILAASLRQIEGNSIMLAPRLYRARKMRKLDTSRDTKSLSNYQHILWLAREGLSILEVDVLPYTQAGQYGAEAAVLTAKLRASFLHIFALFHNQPPVTKTDPRSSASTTKLDPRSSSTSSAPASKPKDPGGRATGLRDPVGSITSETSFVTNPYAGNPAKPSNGAVQSPQPPPGLPGLPSTPRPSAFILPPLNFLPMAESYFSNASRLAAAYLPGSHPLRLSVEVEHCAFIWDCLHDHQYARRLARHTIREVYHAKEGMDDEDFEDAAKMVDHLGKVMKRKSIDTTPKMAGTASPHGANDGSPITKQDWMEREARSVGGGLRGAAHVQGQLGRLFPPVLLHNRYR
ncbi:14-3-3 domain-containing protein [Macrophomina phaseolina]|uniref:14-3-3 domain-containing protein n=1 Tax=Macrophomina phaseolina TaxID=35725 RepID=A0ABQ8FUS9_9PEZI|nr:14-3-3 domain-containing protein [Macrophomina phaseolina]